MHHPFVQQSIGTFIVLMLIWAIAASALLCVSLLTGYKGRFAASQWSARFGFFVCAIPCVIFLLSSGQASFEWLGAAWIGMNFAFLFAAAIIVLFFENRKAKRNT